LERRVEREWKSIRCPHGEDRARVLYEWDVIAVEGRILKKELKLIDCHRSALSQFGGKDCGWICMQTATRRQNPSL
jgi:hypothetical protein